jgi:hypothetical protein
LADLHARVPQLVATAFQGAAGFSGAPRDAAVMPPIVGGPAALCLIGQAVAAGLTDGWDRPAPLGTTLFPVPGCEPAASG